MADESEFQPTVPFAKLVGDLTTEDLVDGDEVVSIFALIKTKDVDGTTAWEGRSGGEPLSSEELLGALIGIADSIRTNLASDWDW
jgi:hypothetical protein